MVTFSFPHEFISAGQIGEVNLGEFSSDRPCTSIWHSNKAPSIFPWLTESFFLPRVTCGDSTTE